MKNEEWPRRIVKHVLNRDVELHDDGSANAMYDLRIGPVDAPEIAIECVGAVDKIYTETWIVGPAKGSLDLPITGNWIVGITKATRINIIKKHLEQLLRGLEDRGISPGHVDFRLRRLDPVLFNQLEKLQITFVGCYEAEGSGKVYLNMPGVGGAASQNGDALAEWIGVFLRSPNYKKDVLPKLANSGAPERHAFVTVEFYGTPFEVYDYLARDFQSLPSRIPDLPEEVTGVWIVSTFGSFGVYWYGQKWRFFDIPQPTVPTSDLD